MNLYNINLVCAIKKSFLTLYFMEREWLQTFYLQYKKIDSDAAMPSTIVPLRERCIAVMGRASPVCSPYSSDAEESDNDDVSLMMETDFENIGVVIFFRIV